MEEEARRLTVTEGGKPCEALGKVLSLPWEVSVPRGAEESAEAIVSLAGEGPNR